MADIIIRDDHVLDVLAPSTEMPEEDSRVAPRVRSQVSRGVVAAVGIGCAAVLAAYFVAGSVRVGAGTSSGTRLQVETIWIDFTEYLRRQGASTEIVLLVTGCGILAVVGSCLLIGLAFAMRDEDSGAK